MLVSPFKVDPLRLHITNLVLHVVHLGLVTEALEHGIFLSQLYAHFTRFIVKWTLELPMNICRGNLAVIFVFVVSDARCRHLVVKPLLEPETHQVRLLRTYDSPFNVCSL